MNLPTATYRTQFSVVRFQLDFMGAFRVQGVLTVKLLSLVRPKAIRGNKMRKSIITKGTQSIILPMKTGWTRRT
jgi:hypothetical protein